MDMLKAEAFTHVFEPQSLGRSINSTLVVRLVARRPLLSTSDKQPLETVGLQDLDIPQLLLLAF
jgi:hypothetical protein